MRVQIHRKATADRCAVADFATYMTANTFESIMAFPRADDRETWFAAERDVQAAHEQSRVWAPARARTRAAR